MAEALLGDRNKNKAERVAILRTAGAANREREISSHF